uniref:Uncharacterized protein n=1 Tax=Triticum urartu TaxID=4572 RepID=A0A8R7U0W5_TRIUA
MLVLVSRFYRSICVFSSLGVTRRNGTMVLNLH